MEDHRLRQELLRPPDDPANAWVHQTVLVARGVDGHHVLSGAEGTSRRGQEVQLCAVMHQTRVVYAEIVCTTNMKPNNFYL